VELFKLHVQNLGRIREAELSIRPLTVFIGPNNTNKTWTAYALYGLAHSIGTYRPSIYWDPPGVAEDIQPDQSIVDAVAAKASEFLRLTSEVKGNTGVEFEIKRSELIADLRTAVRLRVDASGLSRILASSQAGLSAASAGIQFKVAQAPMVCWDRLTLSLQRGAYETAQDTLLLRTKLNRADGQWGERIFIDEHDTDALDRQVKKAIMSLALDRLGKVFVLPAERKGLLVLEESLTEGHISQLPLPLANYVAMLRGAKRMRPGHPGSLLCSDLCDLLEKSLLQGTVDFRGDADSRTLEYTLHNDTILRMHVASSLVRAMAGLSVYMRQIAHRGDVLVIDEPEMNAHPEAQLMIAELLGILVNKGINIVITTHSPYIVDHINNLTEAARVPEDKRPELAERFRLKTAEAFVPPENVATYTFGEDGRVTDVFDRDTGIVDWETFGKQSDYVGNLYNSILDALPRE